MTVRNIINEAREEIVFVAGMDFVLFTSISVGAPFMRDTETMAAITIRELRGSCTPRMRPEMEPKLPGKKVAESGACRRLRLRRRWP
jgi:hypothetical protein